MIKTHEPIENKDFKGTSDSNIIVAKLQHEVEVLNQENRWLKEQLGLLKKAQFGKSSEIIDSNQMSFFNEIEVEQRPQSEEPTIEEITYKRRKAYNRGLNRDAFKDLPVEKEFYELPEEERLCECCQGELHSIGTEVKSTLEYVPARLYIKEVHMHKYACRNCQLHEEATPIKKASAPAPLLMGSFVSPSLLAQIVNQKFNGAVPFDRQERLYHEIGIEIKKQNMANWCIKVSELWLEPLYERMRQYLIMETFLHADETTLTVLDKTFNPTGKKTYMWVYGSGELSAFKIAMFDHCLGRAGAYAKVFLNGFSGYLQTDDFNGYNKVENVIRVGCHAHARRYFFNAYMMGKKNAPVESGRANEALKFFKVLFKLEASFKKDQLTVQERYEKRLEVSKPVLEAFFVWLKENEKITMPKSLLGKAIAYSLSNWELLTNYLLDGQCSLSNNLAERLVKPFVISRKNFLFSKSAVGAKASATYFTLIETAKLNGLNPFAYLMFIMEQLPNISLTTEDALDHLLPWSPSVVEKCKSIPL
ncbi:IS66 family transposase [Fusibacter sp. 3D3]|uniref:IS66 family transposase n=1 Tax=Fusibacter sp. 3D3 TaxID=1048380 RepID=UPI00085357C9|nr:IS66 family transposase [Fusibacter sp. 3D3]GAU77767.1 mobile element protein [Fusibacter sp. 3D3]